ncbi:GspE/PulE family protein [Rubrivivax sp. JA1026]|uniref:GspE/PulE family protein n=1 Tax=Rubrivivax sp. JA1026 TaxID=2710888 RepID=UPI0019805C1B|nr:ATPase, T2SS/T4P/T4SS family [Rubrivivax sp. JA1026]
MTDLSLPPHSYPGDSIGGEPTPGARHEAFAWPTPPLPGYPPPARATQPEACEVEGHNGKVMVGRLMYFHPADGLLKLRVAASRMTVTLRFDQFRRLRLLHPLAPVPADANADTVADGSDARPAEPFALLFKDGTTVEGLTMGHEETEHGLFVFEPLDLAGSVRRSFFPSASYRRASLGGSAWAETDAVALDEAPPPATPAAPPAVCQTLGVRPVATIEDLTQAIDDQARMPMVRIGEALIALGFITPRELDGALEQQKNERGVALGQLLVRQGVVSQENLQTALARKMRYPVVDAGSFPIEARALQRLPYAIASRLTALPLILHGGRLVVALEDPSQRLTIDEIEFASQCKVVPVLARAGTLAAALHAAYDKIGAVDLSLRRLGDGGAATEFEPEDAGKLLASLEQTPEVKGAEDDGPSIEQSDNSLVRLINTMILEAQAQGVSDIHVETQPGREKVRIRFRKDGQLRPYLELPPTYRNALLARLKIMCDLDISERRKPQDGKINFGRFVPGQRLELRVATIPTHSGLEDAVLRLLASAKPLPLDKLGLSANNLERFKAVVARPYGMVLCVGPTGSGKTTTLHSALGYINTPDRKIWTAEDPIEITQAGLRQVQVNPRIDWTFAKALRAFLRADPDVIMVGEIRDQETSQVAIEASLTGHLVLSTLHTNSAPETVTRLLDMGMDPFNFADALLAVLAQRLVRRLCPDCRQPYDAGEAELAELLADYRHAMGDAENVPGEAEVLADWRRRLATPDGRYKLYRPAGCPKCDGSGFRGRAAIHELMTVSRRMRQLIQTGARAEELQRCGLSEGMRTLRQDGIEKVLAGVTTLEEVRAVSN